MSKRTCQKIMREVQKSCLCQTSCASHGDYVKVEWQRSGLGHKGHVQVKQVMSTSQWKGLTQSQSQILRHISHIQVTPVMSESCGSGQQVIHWSQGWHVEVSLNRGPGLSHKSHVQVVRLECQSYPNHKSNVKKSKKLVLRSSRSTPAIFSWLQMSWMFHMYLVAIMNVSLRFLVWITRRNPFLT